MKFRTLNGKEVNININQSKHPIRSKENSKSKFQYEVGQVLIQIYPNYPILEEVYILIEHFRIDFMIPKLKLAFECQGKQHDEFNPHFHKHYHNFTKSQERDQRKLEWCQLNDFDLIYIPYGCTEKKEIKKLIDLEV